MALQHRVGILSERRVGAGGHSLAGFDSPGPRVSGPCLLPALEILNRTLVSFSRFLCTECAKVAAAAGFGIFVTRVQTVLTGLQLPNHRAPRHALMPRGGSGVEFFPRTPNRDPDYRIHSILSTDAAIYAGLGGLYA